MIWWFQNCLCFYKQNGNGWSPWATLKWKNSGDRKPPSIRNHRTPWQLNTRGGTLETDMIVVLSKPFMLCCPCWSHVVSDYGRYFTHCLRLPKLVGPLEQLLSNARVVRSSMRQIRVGLKIGCPKFRYSVSLDWFMGTFVTRNPHIFSGVKTCKNTMCFSVQMSPPIHWQSVHFEMFRLVEIQSFDALLSSPTIGFR